MGSQGMGVGYSQTCRPPLSPGHSAPDEVSGGEALLHEHQLGAGELQQVCGSLPLRAPHPRLAHLPWPQPFSGEDATSLCLSAHS